MRKENKAKKRNVRKPVEKRQHSNERKRTEEAMRILSSRHEAILAAVPDIIMEVDNNKRYTWANQAGVEFFGEDVIGKKASFYFEGEQDTYNIVQPLFNGDEDTIYLESWQRRRDGHKRLLSWWCRTLKDSSGNVKGALSSASDITERKQAEEDLRKSNIFLHSIIEQSPYAMWISDANGTLIRLNQACCNLLNIKAQEVVGKYNILKDNIVDKQGLIPLVKSVFEEGSAVRFEIRYDTRQLNKIQLKERAVVILDVSIFPIIDIEGKITNAVIQHINITEQKLAEEELKKHHGHLEELVKEQTIQLEKKVEELEQANTRLQEVDRLKSVFLASMSHELRTPLNSIIGFTGIILQGMSGKINQEQRKQLTMVKNSANHLLDLINDVLDISKIEAGRIELSLEEMRLDAVVEEVAEAFSVAASEKDLALVTEVPGGISFLSDRRRVKQVLMNLVSNAIKFTERGSVKIAARVAREDRLEIRVIDTGIGIKKEDMSKLFTPFQQVDMSSTKKHEGTGLGLYLVKKLARILGGDVWAQSEYSRGSEFIVTVPLRYKGNTE